MRTEVATILPVAFMVAAMWRWNVVAGGAGSVAVPDVGVVPVVGGVLGAGARSLQSARWKAVFTSVRIGWPLMTIVRSGHVPVMSEVKPSNCMAAWTCTSPSYGASAP